MKTNTLVAQVRLALAAAAALTWAFAAPAHAIDEAEAASGPPFRIPVFVSSRLDTCYDPGNVEAIKTLATRQQNEINAKGGISGRPIALEFLDDERDDVKAVNNVRAAIGQPDVIAMIGLTSSNRGKAVFSTLGEDIKKSGIPFISDIAVDSQFKDLPNVYSTRASQDNDSVPVIANFVKGLNYYSRPAFAGLANAAASTALGDGLKTHLGETALVADIRVNDENDKVPPDEIARIVAGLKEANSDFVVVMLGGANVQVLLKELVAAGVTPALFVGGRIDNLPDEIKNGYANPIYRLAWDRPPEVYNDRLLSRMSLGAEAQWVFEGRKNPGAPGWPKGECKERDDVAIPNPLNDDNLSAINAGSRNADMIALVADAAKRPDKTTDIAALRAEILKALRERYVSGQGSFKGTYDNWSFVPRSRTAARDPFVIILPQGLGRTQLAQSQFMRAKDGSLRPIETLYADIDLIKAHRIDENDKSFFAEFYLAMRSSPTAQIEKIEFANAALDAEKDGGRQITIETVHKGGASLSYPDSMKIYKIAGRFLFEPDLANYPLDTQRFSIDLQPKSGEAPFIVQPPPLALRDRLLDSDGWDQVQQYVSYDEKFVPVVDAFTHAPSVVPFYKARFVWQLTRQATDYFLRVTVPLAFILFVAYLSIFIPRTHFEAIVTIQVTALLSAVALYLALPKLDSGIATLSDRAFVFAYMILSIMIGLTILRINPWTGGKQALNRAWSTLHVVLIPVLVIAVAYYVYGLSDG